MSGELTVDFYATPEQRDRVAKELAAYEDEFYEKRLLCREFCGKFQDHLALMRKDLLSLSSNEDAVIIHEELKGITDVRSLPTVQDVPQASAVHEHVWDRIGSICVE
jgi:hypothetical protein